MLHLLKLNNLPILEQLRIEEALLRADTNNWCLISTGAPPAIVMGISGKPEKLLDIQRVKQDKIPVIKRFSGGGTVYIDPDTIFITFICNAELFDIPLQPRPILKWSENFYKPIFKEFQLRDNDYVFGEKKFGGNAQYIKKNRWLHHTSFLWNFDLKKMDYLLLPEKRPAYRKDRDHRDFLCSLNTHFPQKQTLLNLLSSHICRNVPTVESSLEEIAPILERPHRKATSTFLL